VSAKDSKHSTLAQFLKVKQAARLLGVSVSTLRNWDRQGKLRPVRNPMNGYRLYRPDDLEKILSYLVMPRDK
jgi:excisionase family DNA binding protein